MTERGRLAALLVLLLLASGCAATVRSQVLDADTQRPVAEAVVLGVWTRCAGLVFCRHQFVGARETVTDETGWFSLERLPSSGLYGEAGGQAITVYKHGYAPWSNLFVFPTGKLHEDRGVLFEDRGVPRQILLERFPEQQSYEKLESFINDATRSQVSTQNSPRMWDSLEQVRKRPQLRYKTD